MSRWYHRKSKDRASISQSVFVFLALGLFGLYLTYGKIFLMYLILVSLVMFGLMLIIRRHGWWGINKGVEIGQTKYSRLLWAALKERGIDAITEYSDGHKKVDLAVLPAKIYIEVDGLQHSLDKSQVISDLKRDNYSDKDGFRTIRIPNQAIREDLNTIADIVAEEIKERRV